MAERAQVKSVEAIAAFRAHLIVYLAKARPTAEEVDTELLHVQSWLENDQRDFWVREIRSLGRELEQAQAELFTARLSKLQTASASQEMAVQRLRGRLREAEEKQSATRKWARELDSRAEPLAKEVENLHSFLTVELAQAVRYLDQVIKSLDAYARSGLPGGSPPAAPASEPPPAEPAPGTNA
jgi:hypothetical protein